VSVITGLGAGYVIGGRSALRPLDRILLGSICGLIGGLIVGFLLGLFIVPAEASLLMAVFSSFTGAAFGLAINWTPAPTKPPKQHTLFEPDDDDEFDRQIEDALGHSQ
jgi:hypothetical protein